MLDQKFEEALTNCVKSILQLVEVTAQKAAKEAVLVALQDRDNNRLSNIESNQLLAEYPPLMRVTEVAKVLRISRQKVYEIILSRPDFPHIRLSEKRTRIPRDAFLKWLKDNNLE